MGTLAGRAELAHHAAGGTAIDGGLDYLAKHQGADGAFDTSNQAYLVWWGQTQFVLQLKNELRVVLDRGLRSANAHTRLRALHAGLRILPVETRADFWQLGLEGEEEEPKKNRMRNFLDARDLAQNELYLEFLPRYLELAKREQAAGVARLIAGTQLRDNQVVAQVLNWKLKQVENITELADALWVELVDAAYSRFNRSGKLGTPEGNPMEAFRNESTAKLIDTAEELFAQVFGAALIIADTRLNRQGPALLAALLKKIEGNTGLSTIAFVIETLLFHLDKKFNEDTPAGPLVVNHAEGFLTPLVAFLGPATEPLKARPWRHDVQNRAQYVLEEAILRRLGWFPPNASVITQAVGVVRGELQRGPAESMSHQGRAAFRLLTETPDLFLGEVIQSAKANPHAVLGDAAVAREYEACVIAILDLYDKVPPPPAN